MDARAALLIGGGTAVAASVAIASVLALTSASALADRAGSPMADSAIVVPGQPSAAPTHSPAAARAETVPAPEPKDIAVAPVKADPTAKSDASTSADRSAQTGPAKAPAAKSHAPADRAAENGAENAAKPRPATSHRPSRPHDRDGSWRAQQDDAGAAWTRAREQMKDEQQRMLQRWRDEIAEASCAGRRPPPMRR
ncbi:hypothetical protein [Microbacterium elymi]|uniref:Uncharacterized protein n=1 Tax=Microbacterium elymi TaxID=2909587 RepID=A0ABY5NK77_9MICO|nr:hypothetical protein [Microbacterium elymi]UUT35572.1 hypothetical protein L2X98_19830 [Microbacterium elymi]